MNISGLPVHPVVQDPQKWIDYYKSTLGKGSRSIQRGNGGTLGPMRRGRGGGFVMDRTTVVTPTEQAESEIKHRQFYIKGRDGVHIRRRCPTVKRARSTNGEKASSKKTGTK